MGRSAFALMVLVALAGCGGADDGQGAGGSDPAAAPSNGTALPPSNNDSSQDDGSGWPRWKNPCPGPACDPYRNDPRWLVDPPPDQAVTRERVLQPSLPELQLQRMSSPAAR